MDKQEIVLELTRLIGDFLKEQNLDLVELIYRYEGKDLMLRILVDRPEGGISLGECSQLNNQIGVMLDERSILQQRYVLEVSSPGLDRPLIAKSDFGRCINRAVRFFLRSPLHNKTELDGVVQRVDDEAVYIDVKGAIIKVPFVDIARAKQIIEGF